MEEIGGEREDVGVKCQMGEGGETRLSPFTFFTQFFLCTENGRRPRP